MGEDRGMAARGLLPDRTGQNRCSLGLPSGRVVARKAIGKHGVPGGAGCPRSKAVMPGQSIAAAAAICGAPDSNSCQVATMPLSRHSCHEEPDHRSLTDNRCPVYLDSGTADRCGFGLKFRLPGDRTDQVVLRLLRYIQRIDGLWVPEHRLAG